MGSIGELFSGSTLVALWLLGILSSYNLYADNPQLAQLVALVWPLPFVLFGSRAQFFSVTIFRQYPALAFVTVSFFLLILGGASFSIAPTAAIAFSLLTIVGFFICAKVWDLIQGRELKALRIYAFVGLSLVSVVLLSSYQGHGRLGIFRNPNALALIVTSLIISSFAIRTKIVRAVLISLGSLLIFFANSRASLTGTLLALLIFGFFTWRKLNATQKILVLTSIVPLLLLGIFTPDFYLDAWQHIVEGLALNNPYRGINSGFTGRTEAWKEAIAIWQTHPIFGVGYRVHELYFDLAHSRFSSAHNGYLSTLTETGIVGLALVAILIIAGYVRLVRLALQDYLLAQIGLATVTAYLFIAFFERFLINFGNPTSVLFLMFILMPEPELNRQDLEPTTDESAADEVAHYDWA